MRQRTLNDCGICSVAMFTGQSYYRVSKDARLLYRAMFNGRKFDGFRNRMDMILLQQYGIITREYSTDLIFNVKSTRWRARRKDFKKIVGNKKAIICLPSLNFDNCQHLVYFDGKKLHDPSNLKRYTMRNVWKKCLSVIIED